MLSQSVYHEQPVTTPLIMNIGCIVLAAGQSSRFGSTKLLESIGDQPIIRRVISAVRSSPVSFVHVVVGHDADLLIRETTTLCEQVIVNSDFEDGIGASIAAGMKSLPTDCDAVLIVLGDQPLISASILNVLVEKWLEQPHLAVLSGYLGTYGPPSLFPRNLFPELSSLCKDSGARSFLKDGEFRVVEFDDPDSFSDVDTPDDLDKVCRLHQARRNQSNT
jgi:molybdenum cofactor cytidylyltransferase